MTKTVGHFTYDPQTGDITGPAEYLGSPDFERLMARIAAGADPCGAFQCSPDPITAVLVTIQTNFAAWLGYRQTERMLSR